jgi:hypothetical protein
MTDKEGFQGRIDQLIELDKTKRIALDQMTHNQEKVKGTFDHKQGTQFSRRELRC